MLAKINPHWTAAVFCGFLSALALIGNVTDQFWATGWWKPTFFAFLPMCFVHMGYMTLTMQREINELRLRLETSQSARESGGQR